MAGYRIEELNLCASNATADEIEDTDCVVSSSGKPFDENRNKYI